MKGYAGRRVLVTGASQGIGAEYVRALVAAGADVIAADLAGTAPSGTALAEAAGADGPGRRSAASGRCGALPTGVPAECARESLSRPARGRCRRIGPGPARICPRVGRPACGRMAGARRREPGAAGRQRRPATAP